jgi:alpha-tubulin suppressor-like RCC1 family protein
VQVHGPNNVGCLDDINNVAAGWMHSLALDVNGLVWAWGWNDKGQLGDGFDIPRPTPVQVHGVNDVGYLRYIIAIAAGRSGQHSLAVDANNFVYGWGYNQYGQCGNGEYQNNKLTPVRVLKGQQDTSTSGYLENIVSVSGGQTHSMALEKLDPNNPNCNGRVYTFGSNKWPVDYVGYPSGYGKLGNGNTVDDFITTPVRVLKGEQDTSTSEYLENIVAISAGWDHCMALEKYEPLNPNYKGRVYTWGSNGQGYGGGPHTPEQENSVGGRLGDGTYDNNSTPVIVLRGEQDPNNPNAYLKGIIAVAAGEGHSMALDVNGLVYAWGDNQYGQLGNGKNDPCTRPVKVVGPDLNHNGIHEPNEGYLENIVAISAGFWHCLAIDANGTVWTWGKGKYGRLGLGDTTNRNIPHRMPPVVYNITQETFYFGIQSAINEANNGDVIEASIGIYYENVDFLDKSIMVRSISPDDRGVVTQTIIDGTDFDVSLNGVVEFHNNSGSTLAGFTVRRNKYHNGIYCDNSSSPNIISCNIEGNSNYGIWCDTSDPNIINCNIEGNNAGGICCGSFGPNITGCLIARNGKPDIDGGGMFNELSSPTVTNCVFVGNRAGWGGGMLNNIFSYPTVTSCIFIGNSASSGGGMSNSQYSSPTVTNCVFSRNDANYGGGIFNFYYSHPTVINCTFRGNTADPYGGGMYNDDNSSPAVTNCIFWDNKPDEIYNYSFDPTVSYCDIQGDPVYLGIGNINADPCFYDAATDPNSYHLTGNSPCIDWGNNSAVPPSVLTDIDGEKRKIDGDNNGTTIVDIGADEYYWSPADFNRDEFVNFIDYAIFADACDSYAGGPKWNPDCNIGTPVNNRIDYNDFAAFCKDWLWQAGWTRTFTCGAGMGMIQTMGQGMSRQTMTASFAPAEALYPSVSAGQQVEKIELLDVKELINWLEELWLDPEVRKVITEDEWLEFIKSVKESYKVP